LASLADPHPTITKPRSAAKSAFVVVMLAGP
jgi:hypothetical protein